MKSVAQTKFGAGTLKLSVKFGIWVSLKALSSFLKGFLRFVLSCKLNFWTTLAILFLLALNAIAMRLIP